MGNAEIGIAHPLLTIANESNEIRFREIGCLISEWKPVLLVVGLPLHMDGSEHELTRLCRKFANRLAGRFNLPVEFVDERLTSVEASQTLRQAGVRGIAQKPMVDQVAAQHILQSYMDNQTHATT